MITAIFSQFDVGTMSNSTTKPDFLIIGSPKSGTTTLWHLIRQHPDIFMPEMKEPMFFSHNYERGWDWYRSLFSDAEPHQIKGEASPVYSMCGSYPHVVERIATDLPDARLIFIVRHPMKQVESHWLQFRKVSARNISHDFNQAVKDNISLLDTAMYWRQMQAYLGHFSKESIQILFFDDLISDSHQVCQEVCRFLGVDENGLPENMDTEPQNVAANHQVDTKLVTKMRQSGFLEKAASIMPSPIVRLAKRILKRPIVGKPEWNAEVRTHAIETLQPDAKQFLEWAGADVDRWDFK